MNHQHRNTTSRSDSTRPSQILCLRKNLGIPKSTTHEWVPEGPEHAHRARAPPAQPAVGIGQPSWMNMPSRSLTARICEILPSVTVSHQICSTSKERPVGSGIRGW